MIALWVLIGVILALFIADDRGRSWNDADREDEE